jgi:hypothetical protein
MRSLILILPLALTATACQGPHRQIDDRTLLRREQEKMGLEEKRKQAIFDLSNVPPSNGPDAYFEKQAEQRRSR